MANPSNISNPVYSRIPRPYLDVDFSPLKDAVRLQPCGDHVSKTSAAAFNEKCFCGVVVTSQEDDRDFQFYVDVMHTNAKYEVAIAEKNKEILSLKAQLKQQREESEKHQKLHQDLQGRVNRFLGAKTAEKSEANPLPVVQNPTASVNTATSAAPNAPMEITSIVVPSEPPKQPEQRQAIESSIPLQPPKKPAPKLVAPKRKETEDTETSATQPTLKWTKTNQVGQPLLSPDVTIVLQQPSLGVVKTPPLPVPKAAAPQETSEKTANAASISEGFDKTEKWTQAKIAEKEKELARLKLKRVIKKTEKAKARSVDLEKSRKPAAPKAIPSQPISETLMVNPAPKEPSAQPVKPTSTPVNKPAAAQLPEQLPTAKPAAQKPKQPPVDFTGAFISMKKPAAVSSVSTSIISARTFALKSAAVCSVAPTTNTSEAAPVVQKAPDRPAKQVVVTQVVASAAPLEDPSASQKQIEGVITPSLSSQTANYFAAPVQMKTQALAPAETPEGMQQRELLKNKVTGVLAGILAKKPAPNTKI